MSSSTDADNSKFLLNKKQTISEIILTFQAGSKNECHTGSNDTGSEGTGKGKMTQDKDYTQIHSTDSCTHMHSRYTQYIFMYTHVQWIHTVQIHVHTCTVDTHSTDSCTHMYSRYTQYTHMYRRCVQCTTYRTHKESTPKAKKIGMYSPFLSFPLCRTVTVFHIFKTLLIIKH